MNMVREVVMKSISFKQEKTMAGHRLPMGKITLALPSPKTKRCLAWNNLYTIGFHRLLLPEWLLFTIRNTQIGKGIWSLGLVTGESMLGIAAAAQEPVLSVLIPASPAPFTGYTLTIKKSEAIDLDISIDQAVQFIVSCGVVIAPQQLQKMADQRQTSGTQSLGRSGNSDADESR